VFFFFFEEIEVSLLFETQHQIRTVIYQKV